MKKSKESKINQDIELLKGLKLQLVELNYEEGVGNKEEFKNALLEEIYNLHLKIFKASYLHNEYWVYCSFKVYISTYKKRLKKAIKSADLDIINEETFIENQLEREKRVQWLFDRKSGEVLYPQEIISANLKKIKFLQAKLAEMQGEEELVDYSDSKAAEKIVALELLGVLGFLKAKGHNTNKIAEALSYITGEKTTTLQSYLYPIFGDNDLVSGKNLMAKEPLVKRVTKVLANYLE